MVQGAEQAMAALQQKSLDVAVRLARLSIENSQRIMQLQVDVARELFDDGVSSAKVLALVQDPQEAMEMRARFAQQAAEKMFATSRLIAGLTAEMQTEMGRTVSEQLNRGGRDMFEAMQDLLRGMPLNNHAAAEALENTFEHARKTLEQVSHAATEAFAGFARLSEIARGQ